MLSMLRAVLTLVFVALWIGGVILLFVRVRVAQNTYLRHFNEMDGVPLDGIPLGVPRHTWETMWEAMLEPQFDPALEALRRDTWVRYRWMVAWGFGAPLTIVAIMVLLIVTGHGAWLG